MVTSFVGERAPIEIAGKSEDGKSFGKIKGIIRSNRYAGTLEIPDDIRLGDSVYFEVKLPQHGLSGESERIPAIPALEVTHMKWSQSQARRGDVLTLSARVSNLPERTEVTFVIYEYDRDGAHDKITELPTIVRAGRAEIRWEYEYHEDSDEIPTEEELRQYGESYNPPEYFFTLVIGQAEFGTQQESGLLEFKDWIEIELLDENESPIANAEYKLILADGSERKGRVDANGLARIEDVPPGSFQIIYSQPEEA